MDQPASSDVLRSVTDIIVALLAQRSVDPAQLPDLARQLREALVGGLVDAPEAPAHLPTPALERLPAGERAASEDFVDAPGRPLTDQQVRDSVSDAYLICFEDGRRYRSLRRHLMAKYQMTPDDYRSKWGLPADYPMVAPSYARERSAVARRIGLGHSETRSVKQLPPSRSKR